MGVSFTQCKAMKFFSFLFLISSVYCQDWMWTCDECIEGAKALGEFASTPDAIQAQTDLLLPVVCPQAPDPDLCETDLINFWGILAQIIFPIHYSYICADLTDCPQPTPPPPPGTPDEKAYVPSCEACASRVNSATDYLSADETITGWVDTLSHFGFCDAQEDPDRCKSGIEFLIPIALPALAEADRSWVTEFCTSWGC